VREKGIRGTERKVKSPTNKNSGYGLDVITCFCITVQHGSADTVVRAMNVRPKHFYTPWA